MIIFCIIEIIIVLLAIYIYYSIGINKEKKEYERKQQFIQGSFNPSENIKINKVKVKGDK